MLRFLQVRDFAIVDTLEIEFDEQLTVLTGETGAGKSIVLEALGLVLGDRADADMIRDEASKATITAEFDTQHNELVRTFLDAQGIEPAETCIVKRQLGKDGRSRAFINGNSVTVQQLKRLGELLVDLHGQHEHQSLMRRDVQRELLDAYAENEELAAIVATTASRWREINTELATFQADVPNIESERDRLRHDIVQLEAVRNDAAAIGTLESDHKRFANLTELALGCERALTKLENSEPNVTGLLADTSRAVQSLVTIDPKLEDITQMLSSASITLREAAAEIHRYLSGLDVEPDALNQVEEKLSTLQDLARKHRCSVSALPAQLAELQGALAELENREGYRSKLAAEVESIHCEYHAAATALHAVRVEHAADLSAQVTELMQHLGMAGGHFVVDVQAADGPQVSVHGHDTIEYRVTTNAGHAPRSLSKVVSGGELSRISLAIQVTAVRGKGIPTLVFDEVDVGIGGGVAEIVGRQLRALAEKRQVLCVTHLPQVACLGHQHLQVSKCSDDASTRATIVRLENEQRTQEIARMLGGVTITAKSLAHAKEMLAAPG